MYTFAFPHILQWYGSSGGFLRNCLPTVGLSTVAFECGDLSEEPDAPNPVVLDAVCRREVFDCFSTELDRLSGARECEYES